jgi:hypothetical protein
MTPAADPALASSSDSIRAEAVHHGRAFGIDVEAAFPIPELPALSNDRSALRTTLELVTPNELRKIWPASGATQLVRRTFPDGSPMMILESHEDEGFHIWAPRYGRHVVSGDGADVRCALPRVAAWRWERLLFAQVLPLAAALLGRVLFHASAVAVDGGAFGFSGHAGAGKSSVAAHLVARGASLVTDDILALELSEDGVLAHPGASLTGIDPHELGAMTAEGRALLGAHLGKSDKTYVAAPIVRGPLPLRGLYFLTRNGGRSIEIGPADSTPARLLGSGFISYLRSPRHLVHHLDACARVADVVPTLRVSIPASAPATSVAAAVEAHLQTLLGPS